MPKQYSEADLREAYKKGYVDCIKDVSYYIRQYYEGEAKVKIRVFTDMPEEWVKGGEDSYIQKKEAENG